LNKIEEQFYDGFCDYVKSLPVLSVYSDTWKMKIADVNFEEPTAFTNQLTFNVNTIYENITKKLTGYSFMASLEPQIKIGSYITDFVFSLQTLCGNSVDLCIEIDGHDWHEKTKEQASSDKRRDRDIVLNGYIPIHFTGSEVYTNTVRCVEDVIKIAVSISYNLISSHTEYYENEWEIMGINK